MSTEAWADPELSRDLPQLCAAGEGETLEFKRELPAQRRDLAKEIAALCSTRGGTIILGVEDDGTVIGISGAEDPSVRDELSARVVGISQQIEPPVRPEIKWAQTSGRAVLCIRVRKGVEPLYYVDRRAYIRHASVSRPASPAEIQQAIGETKAPSTPTNQAVSGLGSILARTLRWCDVDEHMRTLSPWVNQWTYEAERNASSLRELSISDWAIDNNCVGGLEQLAEKLDEVAGFRHGFGTASSFEVLCSSVRDLAAKLMDEVVWPIGVSNESLAALRSKLVTYSRHLASLWARAEKNVFDGRVNKAQEETSNIGEQIANWTYFNLTFLTEDARLGLRKIALSLVALASHRMDRDGGESLRRVVDRGKQLSEELAEMIRSAP